MKTLQGEVNRTKCLLRIAVFNVLYYSGYIYLLKEILKIQLKQPFERWYKKLNN